MRLRMVMFNKKQVGGGGNYFFFFLGLYDRKHSSSSRARNADWTRTDEKETTRASLVSFPSSPPSEHDDHDHDHDRC